MDSGSWNRKVWRLAGPIMLSNVSVPLLGAVDTAVVGQLPGARYIAAVAVGAQIFTLVYWGFGFLRMGTTGFTAQSLGARDDEQVRAWFLRAATLACAIGVAILILQRPLAWAAFAVIGPSEDVRALADAYFSIRVWGAPAVLLNYAILGWFIGVQNTKATLLVQLYMNLTNIVLDLWFVLGLGWGVTGVAVATLISEVSACALGLVIVGRIAGRLGGNWRPDAVRDWTRLKRMLGVNRDIMIRTLCLEAAFLAFTAVGARMGDLVLAANAVLLLFQTFMAYALDGFAHAVEALAGHAYGARDRAAFRGAVRASSLWALVFSLAFGAAYWVFGEAIIDLITKTPDVRAFAYGFLVWMAISPVVSVWSFQLDGIFLGTTHTRDMRNAMIASLATFMIVLFPAKGALGNHGLWLAMMALMAARAVTLALRYPALDRGIEVNARPGNERRPA